MIQIVAPRSLALIVYPRQQCNNLGQSVYVSRVPAGHSAELTLTDQSQAKVRVERQIVSSEESRELQLLMISQLPHIIQRRERRMSLILLSRIDRIRILRPAGGGIDGIEAENRPQSRHVAIAQICDSEQRQRMISGVEDLPTVKLELFAVLQPVQESIAERAFDRNP